MRVHIVVIGDGYLYGASRSEDARHTPYWLALRLEREPFTIYAIDVPEDLAFQLEGQGTHEQVFSDGYDAMRAAHEADPSDPWEVMDTFGERQED